MPTELVGLKISDPPYPSFPSAPAWWVGGWLGLQLAPLTPRCNLLPMQGKGCGILFSCPQTHSSAIFFLMPTDEPQRVQLWGIDYRCRKLSAGAFKEQGAFSMGGNPEIYEKGPTKQKRQL